MYMSCVYHVIWGVLVAKFSIIPHKIRKFIGEIIPYEVKDLFLATSVVLDYPNK